MPSRPLRLRPIRRAPGLLILVGFALTVAGVVLLCSATIQMQQIIPASTLGPGAVTLTFTGNALTPGQAVALAWLMAIPFVLLFVRSRFYLMTVVAPALVALTMPVWVYQYQFNSSAGSLVLSSAFWTFFGDALVFLACGLEIVGIIWERNRRATQQELRPGSRATPSPTVPSPPR